MPYILDILPHLQYGDYNSGKMLELALKHWPAGHAKPHLFADAAFGTWKAIDQVSTWGGTATFSWTSSNTSWLWELLSHSLPANHWRAAYLPTLDCVATSHALVDSSQKKVYQQIVSTAWDVCQPTSTAEQEPEEEEEREAATPSSMPIFLEQNLQGLKIAELRGICQKYNIKQGAKKANYISNILQRSQTVHQHLDEVEAIQKAILEPAIPDPSPAHISYREWFNLVDLVDRMWYSVEETHQHHSWRQKMILAILRFAAINSWTYSSNLEYASWKDWRFTLAKELIKN